MTKGKDACRLGQTGGPLMLLPTRSHPSEVVRPSGTIVRPLKRSTALSSSGRRRRRRRRRADCIGLVVAADE